MQPIARILLTGAVVASAVAVGGQPAMAGGDSHIVLPGQSIQAAVDAAHPGDTIQLLPGTYDGGVRVAKPGITIQGADGATVLRPGGTNHCLADAGPSGICVIGVHGVTVRALGVEGFDAFGVIGFQTDALHVTAVHAVDNGEYGITEFESTRGEFVGNWVSGTREDAGLYVGDIADAHGTKVVGNHTSGNALGVLVRHAHNVTVSGNFADGNCTGIALVDDGQAGGQGDNRVTANIVTANNRFCPPSPDGVPPLQGAGIILVGGQRNEVSANKVDDNLGGPVPFPGGILLVPGVTAAGGPGAPAAHNLIKANVAHGNLPADLINHSGSGSNVFEANVCGTSQPAGLCV
ncbi:hypothetical protein Lfu02_76260 [Longispora fulva]|uniref:Nitrous oxidase accessory protein NosD n=1 Tax=Longispora fulva TaxID=619741 RepID=A0A8J7KXW1_9ACTN|nr:right-handed parallel beta-helix repeat-containing protein [Longispora fulva]MBG6138407.1 nitrous oxidase accessory protein NosD [Longispora fulva]GIG63254.1 hypothetical protein Lfu02_76260 [Longispora fulva]